MTVTTTATMSEIKRSQKTRSGVFLVAAVSGVALLLGLAVCTVSYSPTTVVAFVSGLSTEYLQKAHYRRSFHMVPVVITTWNFYNATVKAWDVLKTNGTALDAVELGCNACEDEQCDGTVGFGGSPDENGETRLDALIIDGPSHAMGAVASLRRVKHAVSVARAVMMHTKHTFLVGEAATSFALSMGFQEEDLSTSVSREMWANWQENGCQPNFWQNVKPAPNTTCGPYIPLELQRAAFSAERPDVSDVGHDTIGMLAIDSLGNMAAATSTNGARFKIPGRVGDSPIPGSGAYVDQEIGAAAATGDGDVLMRFLPSLITVENMRNGMTASVAAQEALQRIVKYYPGFQGAIVAVKASGEFGAACYGFSQFPYSVANVDLQTVHVLSITCSTSELN